MADTRFLLRRGHAWYFAIAVPRTLRGRFRSNTGKSLHKIVLALGTGDPAEARRRRWPLVYEWRERFERAASGVSLSLREIDGTARDCYLSTLERFAVDARRRKLSTAEDLGGLSIYLDNFVDELAGGTVENTVDDWNDDGGDIDLDAIIEHMEPAVMASEIAAVERRKGITLDPSDPTRKILAQGLARATLAAIDGRMRLLRGKPSEEPATFLGAHGIDPVTLRPIASERPKALRAMNGGGKRFAEAAAAYVTDMAHSDWTAQTKMQNETVFRLFADYCSNAPFGSITRAEASEFLEQFSRLDPHYGQQPGFSKELSFAELQQRFGKPTRQLATNTLNRYRASLSALYNWAIDRGDFDGANPFQRKGRKNGDARVGWRPFTIDELKKLFAGSPDTAEMRWAPPIALYSGARLTEVCQLRTGDVRKRDGVWIFDFTDEAPGQRLKTAAARRIVPVHSKLLDLGFLEYLKALPNGQLFPALRPGGPDGKFGWQFSKRFTRYRRRCELDLPRLGFHSLRKNFAQALKDARATPLEIAELIGHEKDFTTSTYAPAQLPIKVLKELVERVRYPELRLSRPTD
jgi:integrase